MALKITFFFEEVIPIRKKIIIEETTRLLHQKILLKRTYWTSFIFHFSKWILNWIIYDEIYLNLFKLCQSIWKINVFIYFWDKMSLFFSVPWQFCNYFGIFCKSFRKCITCLILKKKNFAHFFSIEAYFATNASTF